MFEKIRREPVLVTGAVQAVLGLLLAFGLELTNQQVGAILAVTAAGLAFVARGQVTPIARRKGEAGESLLVVAIFVVVVCTAAWLVFGGGR